MEMAEQTRKHEEEVNGDTITKKRMKLCEKEVGSVHDSLESFAGFQLVRILKDLPLRKTAFVEGKFAGREEPAVIILEKTPFEKDTLQDILTGDTITEKAFHNDIYGNYQCYTLPKLNGIKTTVIHPATEKLIQKYTDQRGHLFNETPEIYNSITLPHIQRQQLDLKWVYNILEHKKESERIVFEDRDSETGFILLPDLKWDGKQLESLYLMAVCHKRDIKSLRDLNASHLPLLTNILTKSTVAIKEKYGLKGSELRIYVHYQPSYYHFHVHINSVNTESPGIFAEKAHLLTSIINNLELVPDFYQRANLPFVVLENDSLFIKLHQTGHLKVNEVKTDA